MEHTTNELVSIYRDGLLDDTLPFWISNSVDREHGGFMMSLDRDGTLLDTDKCVWQQGRFTWLLGELYNTVEQRQEWLELAEHGVRFLDEYCRDGSDGRMWFELARDGTPLRKRRYSFSEAFAAIAYGEFARATNNPVYASKADAAFRQFIDHNESPLGTALKFTDARPTVSIGYPMITINVAQQLRDSIDLPDANTLIDNAIDTIRRLFVKDDIECVMETVSPDGELINHYAGRTLNPGHAIEGAWFILEEARVRNDSSLAELGCKMLDWMWHRGWDSDFGGMLYFASVDGRPIQEYWHDMKFWWPHNETIIATLLAYQLTGDAKYATWHKAVHDWAHAHFADPENGEWFGYLRRDGAVSNTAKGNLWKGPFHLPRMQLVCWKLLDPR